MVTLTFTQRLPGTVPSSLPVYATRTPGPGGAALEAVARGWSDTAASLRRTRQLGDWFTAEAGHLRLRYNRLSGAVDAAVRSPREGLRDGAETFPVDNERVVAIARAFVSRANLAVDEASRLRVGRITHLRREYCPGSSREVVSEILDAGVVFTRVIDETPVVGPGGQVMVKILPRGAVCGASRVFRGRGERLTTTSIMPPADALAEFERRLRRDPRFDGTVRVFRAQFGYFEAGRSDPQRILEPVYAFVFTSEDGFEVKSAEIIRAGKPAIA